MHSDCHVMVAQTHFLPVVRMKKDGFLLRKWCSKGFGLKFSLMDLGIRHKFYCMLFEIIVSMCSCGVYEIKRHYQSVGYLRKDQRYRDRYFSGVLRGKEARVLHGEYLPAERWTASVLDLWSTQNGPQETVLLRCCRKEAVRFYPCRRTQAQLTAVVHHICEGRGQFWMLDTSWTEEGTFTGNSASISDFKWSQERISSSRFALVVVVYIDVVLPLISENEDCSDGVFSVSYCHKNV